MKDHRQPAMESLPLVNSVVHSIAQLVIAASSGVFVDFLFTRFVRARHPQAEHHQPLDVAIEALELAAQIVVGGIVIGAAMNFIGTLSVEYADPGAGTIFALVFIMAQPSMTDRVERIIQFARRQLNMVDELVEGKRHLEPEKIDASRKRSMNGLGGASRVQERHLYARAGMISPLSAAAIAAQTNSGGVASR